MGEIALICRDQKKKVRALERLTIRRKGTLTSMLPSWLSELAKRLAPLTAVARAAARAVLRTLAVEDDASAATATFDDDESGAAARARGAARTGRRQRDSMALNSDSGAVEEAASEISSTAPAGGRTASRPQQNHHPNTAQILSHRPLYDRKLDLIDTSQLFDPPEALGCLLRDPRALVKTLPTAQRDRLKGRLLQCRTRGVKRCEPGCVSATPCCWTRLRAMEVRQRR